MDFVFYDLETTGVSPAYDQPLQFAAIRTDENFLEQERIELRCQLAPHILPSPYALAVVGISVDQLTDPSLPTLFEFAQELAALIKRWKPAVWTGYNSIRFDEEMLRQTFYQNLLPELFATQIGGNQRFDIMTVVRAVAARTRDLLSWPLDESCNPIFALDKLAPKNGIVHATAHDALGDVQATCQLAEKIARGNPELWYELLENSDKNRVQSKLDGCAPCDLVWRFEKKMPEIVTGCYCGSSTDYANHVAFFDLHAGNPSEWIEKNVQELLDAINDKTSVIRSFAINKCPPLLRSIEVTEETRRRAAVIENAPEFQTRIGHALAQRFAEDSMNSTKPVEKQIFDKFLSDQDKKLLWRFQRSDWTERRIILRQLSDPRLQQIGRRLISFYGSEHLTRKERERYRMYREEKFLAPESEERGWMTLERAKRELSELSQKSIIEDCRKNEIEGFLEHWASLSV
ncbi:MAG: exonuclease domain-containing protein [Aestuariivita sp.]|nr:exonuclease domain-containing protein [Aestuariivita sp.]